MTENLVVCFDADGTRYLVPEGLDDHFDTLVGTPELPVQFAQYKVTTNVIKPGAK